MSAALLIQGDARAIPLRDESVHCVITSPPYWGLRDYGVQDQIGLEKTPEEYVEALVGVFREVRRVLRKDGTVWLNLGDSYAAQTKGTGGTGKSGLGAAFWNNAMDAESVARTLARQSMQSKRFELGGLKPKDLVGIPWRVAFALQADGWWLRSDIIWSKPNPMPESVTDRPTKAHEYLFLLSKSARYYYDAEAIKEACLNPHDNRGAGQNPDDYQNMMGERGQIRAVINPATAKTYERANRRSVWHVSSEPFSGAHFATMPTSIVEPCILAGTSAHGCCGTCESPWRRVVEKGAQSAEWIKACGANRDGTYHGTAQKEYASDNAQDPSAVKARILEGMRERRTIGWSPTCKCAPGETVPALVLDPFSGSGTVPLVAVNLGRSGVGLDLNPEFAAMGRDRVVGSAPLFLGLAP